MIRSRILRLLSPLSRSRSTLTQPPTLYDPNISQPDNEEDNTVKYDIQHMDPNDYLDVVTIYDRIIRRVPVRPKNYKFSSNRKLPGPTHQANAFLSTSFMYDPLSQKFVNHLMEGGNKSKAQRFFSQALDTIRTKLIQAARLAHPDTDPSPEQIDPVKYFHRALYNVMPLMEILKVGTMSQYAVPVKIRDKRRISLAMRSLVLHSEKIGATNEKKDSKLAKVLELAFNKKGTAYSYKMQMNKQCVASRSHAAFRYFTRKKATLSNKRRGRKK